MRVLFSENSHYAKFHENKTLKISKFTVTLEVDIDINAFKPKAFFLWDIMANSEEPDQMPQNMMSGQVLHCLL